MNDKLLKKLIQQDQAGDPAPEVKQRLDNAFMLKSSGYAVRQNSFSGFFSWIFSLKGLGIKTTMAAVIISFLCVNQNVDINDRQAVPFDTTFVEQSLQLDSSLLNVNVSNDSVNL